MYNIVKYLRAASSLIGCYINVTLYYKMNNQELCRIHIYFLTALHDLKKNWLWVGSFWSTEAKLQKMFTKRYLWLPLVGIPWLE